MTGRALTLHEVARMFGVTVPPVGKRSLCPFRKHKRADKTFGVFQLRDGKVLWKCFSCDPPDNVGDAVKLYALLSGKDRKTAWLELRDEGFDVPGANDRHEAQPRGGSMRRMVPVKGRDAEPVRVIPLAKDRWTEVKGKRFGAVEEYGLARGLDPAFLREMDVVDMAKDAVGFGYRDADSGEPCRIKARGLTKKSYWIEPRAREGESGIAKSPLYLAHELALSATWDSVVIVEGEVDALTLRFFGIPAVVSLPDGAGSANRVDLSPVWYRTSLVLSATDADAEGDRAHRDLFARVTGMGKQIARVRWVGRDGTGFKDANDALVLGQFEREDFERCLSAAAAAIFALPAEFADAS